MDVKFISKDKEHMVFILSKTVPAFANAIRRMILDEVPTMAIEDVEFRKNSSIVYDEILAHRLGLLALTTDLKAYNVPAECKCQGEGCARCQLQLTLKAKGAGTVYAEQIESKDPKVVPVFSKTPIVKLLKGQEIELEVVATLGIGKEHAKWSPGHVFYKHPVDVKVNTSKIKNPEELVNVCPKGVFELKGGKLTVHQKNLELLDLNEACLDVAGDGFELNEQRDSFRFMVESWGQLKPKEMVVQAGKLFEEKINTFADKLKVL